jgi:hypothetical protein
LCKAKKQFTPITPCALSSSCLVLSARTETNLVWIATEDRLRRLCALRHNLLFFYTKTDSRGPPKTRVYGLFTRCQSACTCLAFTADVEQEQVQEQVQGSIVIGTPAPTGASGVRTQAVLNYFTRSADF